MDINAMLVKEFSLRREQVENTIRLIDEGNTIPFIARYRKEATGSLDDQVLRELSERLEYLRGLQKKREDIEKTLTELGVLTAELSGKLSAAQTLAELEDLYRPYRPKRRTRATVARERGLEPLANALLLQASRSAAPEELAAPYADPNGEVPDAEAALAGARDILAERMADDADARGQLRSLAFRGGVVKTKNAKDEDSVYAMYYDFSEPVARIPGHRILAINRGEREEYLRVSVLVDDRAANGGPGARVRFAPAARRRSRCAWPAKTRGNGLSSPRWSGRCAPSSPSAPARTRCACSPRTFISCSCSRPSRVG